MKAPAALAGASTGAMVQISLQHTIARDGLNAIKALYLDIYRAYLDLKPTGKGGKRYKAGCPFHHDRHPSLIVFENGRFWCPVCDISGDPLDFIMRHDRVTFPEAKRAAAALVGVILDHLNPAEARRMAEARRQGRERAALIAWRDRLILALRDVRNKAWDAASAMDRETAGADPNHSQTWNLIAEAVERRRNGDTVDAFCDHLATLDPAALADLRARLESSGVRRAA